MSQKYRKKSGEAMNISRLAVDRLLKINWFINLGKPTVLYHATQLTDENAFIKEIASGDWEDTTLEARNEITGHLAKKHSNDYQEWNTLAREAQGIIDTEITPLVTNNEVVQHVILDNIKWDLINYLMEDAYKKHLKGSLFFESLINIYEHGHIPCGWNGKWPVGKLIIY
ncbi:hypothetical protein [Kosakonia oryzendophytica]|nr:hypothetical protein [Kosakonia oryzendophytica]